MLTAEDALLAYAAMINTLDVSRLEPPTSASEESYAHSGAIARAMRANPGLTEEEARALAESCEF